MGNDRYTSPETSLALADAFTDRDSRDFSSSGARGGPMDRTEALKAFASEVALLKFRAGNLGLYKTMHALEAGVTAVGYEIAEKIEKSQRKPKRTSCGPNHSEAVKAGLRRAGRAS